MRFVFVYRLSYNKSRYYYDDVDNINSQWEEEDAAKSEEMELEICLPPPDKMIAKGANVITRRLVICHPPPAASGL